MKTKNILHRQGDVLIERIADIPKHVTKQKTNGRIILAHGEATGHHHSLEADAADWWKDDKTGDQFLAVTTPTQVVHEEHSPINLSPGKYRVRRQKEYSPAAIRNVAD